MKNLLSITAALLVASAYGDPLSPDPPAEVKSIPELTRYFERLYDDKQVPLEWVHFKTLHEGEALVLWYSPFSGIKSVFVYIYQKGDHQWQQVYNRRIDGTQLVSPALSRKDASVIIIRSLDDQQLDTYKLHSRL